MNILNNLEKNHSYLVAMIISFALIMWFRGTVGIIDYIFIPKPEIKYYLLLIFISFTILYIFDVGIEAIFDIKHRRAIGKITSRNNNNNNNYQKYEPTIFDNSQNLHNIATTSMMHTLHTV